MSVDAPQDNATWLFESPTAPHRSEAEWTIWFMDLVAWWVAQSAPLKLPFYRVSANGCFRKAGDLELCRPPLRPDLKVDRWLETVFPAESWPLALHNLRPDVIVRDESTRRASLIEVKTRGASVRRNVDNYESVVEFLVDNGWSAQLFYLLSAGHEDGPRGDWELLEERRSHIILWEDVLAAAIGSDIHKIKTDLKYRDCLNYLIEKLPPA